MDSNTNALALALNRGDYKKAMAILPLVRDFDTPFIKAKNPRTLVVQLWSLRSIVDNQNYFSNDFWFSDEFENIKTIIQGKPTGETLSVAFAAMTLAAKSGKTACIRKQKMKSNHTIY